MSVRVRVGILFAPAALFLSGCLGRAAPDPVEKTPGAQDGSSAGTTAGTSSSEVTPGSGDDDTPPHGMVSIELRRGVSESGDPFVGTAEIHGQLDYGDCLAEFYFGDGNAWAADSPSGEALFDAWEDKLCDANLPFAASCEIIHLGQTLDNSGIFKIATLNVTYEITDPHIELLRLYVGPIPLEEVVGCLPSISLNAHSLIGVDVDGEIIWEVESYHPATSDPSVAAPFQVQVKTGG